VHAEGIDEDIAEGDVVPRLRCGFARAA